MFDGGDEETVKPEEERPKKKKRKQEVQESPGQKDASTPSTKIVQKKAWGRSEEIKGEQWRALKSLQVLTVLYSQCGSIRDSPSAENSGESDGHDLFCLPREGPCSEGLPYQSKWWQEVGYLLSVRWTVSP
jgi:hypothetical protein